MIATITGTPGSGKSLKAAYDIILKLTHGINIIANFDIKLDYFGKKKIARFTYFSNEKDQMNPKNLLNYARIYHQKDPKTGDYYENQTTVYIDECTAPQYFNCKTFGKKEARIRRVWVAFFQLHRKLGFNVFLICQKDKDMDRQIRSFCETQFICRNIKNYKTMGRILCFFFGGMFVCIERSYTYKAVNGKYYYLLHKKKANIYNSMQMFIDLDQMIEDIDKEK